MLVVLSHGYIYVIMRTLCGMNIWYIGTCNCQNFFMNAPMNYEYLDLF